MVMSGPPLLRNQRDAADALNLHSHGQKEIYLHISQLIPLISDLIETPWFLLAVVLLIIVGPTVKSCLTNEEQMIEAIGLSAVVITEYNKSSCE